MQNTIPVRMCGFKLLVRLIKTTEKTSGGIYVPEETKSREDVASVKGEVMDMGPDAYQDRTRFPNGPWCAIGDTVLMRSYAGSRISIAGAEYRIINDDSVEAVISSPESVERA